MGGNQLNKCIEQVLRKAWTWSQRRDFPIHISLARGGSRGITDKDMLTVTKEYHGEGALPLDDWFWGEGSALEFDDPGYRVS
jgi:hypothetical protein